MSIIISKRGKEAQRLERTVIQEEEYLQKYIYNNPESLPLHEVKEDIQLLILAREFPTESGPIDALGIDQDGDIYIIETKLYKNADKRRVIAQMLDYGASLWSRYADPAQFSSKLAELVASGFNMSLEEKLQDFYGCGSEDVSELLHTLKQNINEGNFRFVVLMDRLDDRLKDLIRFVNQNSRFDVLGIELDFYQHEDLEILIPNIYGAEVKKEVSSTSGRVRQKWSKEKFFEDAQRRMGSENMQKLRQLYQWSADEADSISWGTGALTGSFNLIFDFIHPTRSIISVRSNGDIVFNFKWMEGVVEPIQKLGECVRQFSDRPVSEDILNTYITVSVERWSARFEELMLVLERGILEVAKTFS